jgi:predicted transcriptional regulator
MTTSTFEGLAEEMHRTLAATRMSPVSFSTFTGISYRTLRRAFEGRPVRMSTAIAIRSELRRACEQTNEAIALAQQPAA